MLRVNYFNKPGHYCTLQETNKYKRFIISSMFHYLTDFTDLTDGKTFIRPQSYWLELADFIANTNFSLMITRASLDGQK
jgi:hypothetical protein